MFYPPVRIPNETTEHAVLDASEDIQMQLQAFTTGEFGVTTTRGGRDRS
jgi:hypothetical protein